MSAVATTRRTSGAPETQIQPPAPQSAPVSSIHLAEQRRAEQRTKLIQQGLALIGPGLTINRAAWGKELWEYAIGENTAKARKDCLSNLMLELTASTNGMIDERKLTSALKLYHLSTGIPSLVKLNYRIASLFEKIGKLSYSSGLECAPVWLSGAETLIQDILAGKQCCNPKTGIVDRAEVSRAIDAIIGKKPRTRKETPETEEPTETPSDGVTSAESVKQWIEKASKADLVALFSSLAEETRNMVFDALEASLPTE